MMITTKYHKDRVEFKPVHPNNRSKPVYGRTMVEVAVEKDASKTTQVPPRLVSNRSMIHRIARTNIQ